jgi:DNA-binding MarR family transcriptional regulator
MAVTADAVSDLFHQLLSVNRSLRTLSGKQADRLSLSTLMVLAQVESLGQARCSALADLLGVDNSVVSRQLAVLEAAGLTARRADPQDGRAWLAHITEAGTQRLTDLRSQQVALVTDAMSGWTEQDVRSLCGQLVRLDEALQEAVYQNDPASHRGDPTAYRAAGAAGSSTSSSTRKVHA